MIGGAAISRIAEPLFLRLFFAMGFEHPQTRLEIAQFDRADIDIDHP